MKALLVLLVAVTLAGCSSSKPPEPDPGTELPALESSLELPRSVHWMRNSAEYQAILRQTYFVAASELRRIVDDKESGSWAVALDADETVISNTLYEKDLRSSGQQNTSENWGAWVARQEATPISGAIEFLALVKELGGYIAIVTNRSDTDCPDTRDNFRKFDIPFDVMLCKVDDGEKEPRWEMVEKGTASSNIPPVEIVMWIGDNIKDFPDHGQELRFGAETLFADFGTRYFVLPNPMYGSWQANEHN